MFDRIPEGRMVIHLAMGANLPTRITARNPSVRWPSFIGGIWTIRPLDHGPFKRSFLPLAACFEPTWPRILRKNWVDKGTLAACLISRSWAVSMTCAYGDLWKVLHGLRWTGWVSGGWGNGKTILTFLLIVEIRWGAIQGTRILSHQTTFWLSCYRLRKVAGTFYPSCIR